MKEYLEKVLRQTVYIEENDELIKQLPLLFVGRYEIYSVTVSNVSFLALHPKTDVNLTSLRKDRIQVEQASGLNCALFLDNTTFYIKEKLLDEGIPFVIGDKQVYLPFIGYLLNNQNERKIEPVQQISFLTQKMLLTAIYEKWKNIKATVAAERMNISKMSACRCFDELQYLDIDVLDMKGKSRVITVKDDIEKLWNNIKDILRSPVIRRFYLSKDLKLEKKAGISALAELTLLSDDEYPTYGILKQEIKESGIRELRQAGRYEEIGCAVLELGYFIDFDNKNIQDPLSILLTLTDEQLQDERVVISIDDMLNDYLSMKVFDI